MAEYRTVLSFRDDHGYIAEPYWPEMERLINIMKESGMNRARSPKNRRAALEEYLRANALTLADYERLEALAKRPFHTDDHGDIIIPSDKFAAFLVQVCDTARAAQRPVSPDQVRSLIRVSSFVTDRREADGVWERFAVVSGGAGNKLSNQRGLRKSQYIRGFEATGTIELDPEFVKPEVLENAIEWGGRFVGIGASRKMGWGRFTLHTFEEI